MGMGISIKRVGGEDLKSTLYILKKLMSLGYLWLGPIDIKHAETQNALVLLLKQIF